MEWRLLTIWLQSSGIILGYPKWAQCNQKVRERGRWRTREASAQERSVLMLLATGGHDPIHVCGLQTGHSKEKGASCSGWSHEPPPWHSCPNIQNLGICSFIWKRRLCRCNWIKNLELGRLAWFFQVGLINPKRSRRSKVRADLKMDSEVRDAVSGRGTPAEEWVQPLETAWWGTFSPGASRGNTSCSTLASAQWDPFQPPDL